MNLITIDPNVSKEEKLNLILDYVEELKTAFAEILEEFEDEDASEEIVDMLTGALDAIEDANDVILDTIEEMNDL